LTRTRTIGTVAGLLWLAHVGAIALLGSEAPGPLVSDVIQLTLGAVLILSIVQASQRSEGLAISFWRLAAIAYTLLFVAQSLSVYNDLSHTPLVSWANNLLFSFWFVPLAMAMFLDPDHEAGKIDTLIALDFVQAVLVCVAAYLYFFFIPKSEATGELSHEVWAPYFVGYSFVAGSVHSARAYHSISRCQGLVWQDGSIPRALRDDRRDVLLRARTRIENRSMVRSAVERVAGDSRMIANAWKQTERRR
jgi:hypothetical protein